MAYYFDVGVFETVYSENSAQGYVNLRDENGKKIDHKKWNDWIELPYKMRELMKKHKLSIEIHDKDSSVVGKKYTRIGKKKVIE